jgi:hypothetical protein
MPAESRLPATVSAPHRAGMLRGLERILLDYVHGSFYKGEILGVNAATHMRQLN